MAERFTRVRETEFMQERSTPDAFSSIVERHLPPLIAAIAAAVPVDSGLVPGRLGRAMNYSLLAGGKRLRPLLCLLACETVGADTRLAVPAAVSLELVHTYSLIHDDLPAMDDDDLRRGRPTCHKEFDEATAILAGDGLLTYAFEYLVREGASAGLSNQAIAESVLALASAAGPEGMVGGQMADLEEESATETSYDQLVAIHARKTGRLINAALQMGGIAGSATADQTEALLTYGRAVGLAFQIADDVLDEIGDAETIGKAVGKDADRGKATFPTLLGIDESRLRAEELTEEAIEALEPFGDRSRPLSVVARYIVDRNH